MTRLTAHQQREFRNKLILYGVLLVGLVFLFYSVGLKLLINTSLFISKLSSPSQSTNQEKKDLFYGSLTVDNVPTATNSARIVVSGTITNYNILEFYINDEKVKEKEFPASDTFSEEIGDLKPGENELYVKTKEKGGKNEKTSAKYTVIYKNEKPKLEITEPAESAVKTKRQEIKITGKTDKEVFIKVNELPIIVTSEGYFQASVRLKEGDNNITVIAEDDAGNTDTQIVTVTREKDD